MWAAPQFFRIQEQVPQGFGGAGGSAGGDRPAAELQQEMEFRHMAARLSKWGLVPGKQAVGLDAAEESKESDELTLEHPRRRFWQLLNETRELPPFLATLALQPPHPECRTNMPLPEARQQPLNEQDLRLVDTGGAPRDWSEMFKLPPPGADRIGEIRDALRESDEQLKRQFAANPEAPKWKPRWENGFTPRFAQLDKLPPPGEMEYPKEEVKPGSFASRFLRDVGYSYVSGTILGLTLSLLRPKRILTGERPLGYKQRTGTSFNTMERNTGRYVSRFAMFGMWYTLSQHFVFSSFIEDPDEAERAGLVFAGAVSSYRYGYMMSLASAVTIAAAVPLIQFFRNRLREADAHRSFPQDVGFDLF